MRESFYRTSQGRRLYATVHIPPRSPGETGIVFCAPFGEEKKASIRVFADTERALAQAGFSSLLFDYFGTGDSDGNLPETDADAWIGNTIDAAAALREKAGCARIAFLGLRFGALIAAKTAEQIPAESLLLWQPVTDATAYLEAELKRKLVREMLTHGKGKTKREDALAALKNAS